MLQEKLLTLNEETLRVSPSPYAVSVKAYSDIIKRNSVKDAIILLTYVFFVSDPRSEYASYEEDEKLRLSSIDLFQVDDYVPDKYVRAALVEYTKHESSTMQLLQAARTSVAKLKTWLDQLDVTDDDYDALKHMKILESMGKTVKGLKELEEAARKESEISDMWGGVEINKYSEGD
jgi:hypothetical protein